ncbi:MAG: hypothetical protein QOI95_1043 [Acidimicrobiaceae bacterium]
MLPVGTVTLLLADVEGSTRLWESDPAAMTAAVAQLDKVVGEVVERHFGARPVEQGEGDSFVVAFARASDAVACALDLQLADLAPIKLRIGLHTGEVQLRGEGNYIGSTITRCARLRDLGHGGQTLLSNSAQDVVEGRLPDGAWLTELGAHRMRDLDRAERVYQLCHADLEREFRPLRSLDAQLHNLPVQLTTFIGRVAEMAEVRELLGDHRLLTLTGSGGAGKTRLALHVAAEMSSGFPDGIRHAELAPITDPELVATTVARAFGFKDEIGRTATETIIRHAAAARALVILDNCEHLISSSASLADELLRSCPALTILATSREPLGVGGEVAYRVPSLTVSADDALGAVASEAVELFVDRARRAKPGFDLTEANAAAIAEICHRLDGMPLAIELAAARIRVFTPERIAAGLHDRFRLLTGGARTAVQRQQTLRSSVDWSHDLLTEPEQTVFRRLSVFAGSFDFEAAEAVSSGDGIDAHQVLDLLALLVDKSLVLAYEIEGESRYRLLETVRQYGLDKLVDAGEPDDVRRRHRNHYLNYAVRTANTGRSADRLRALEREFDNIRVAFQWSLDVDDIDHALLVAISSTSLIFQRGHFAEGREWIETLVSRTIDSDSVLRAYALAFSAWVESFALGPCARSRGSEAVALARDANRSDLLAFALLACGVAHVFEYSGEGVAILREAVHEARAANNRTALAHALFFLGSGLIDCGAPDAARSAMQEASVLFEEDGNDFGARTCQGFTAMVDLVQGGIAEGHSRVSGVVNEARAVDDEAALVGGLSIQAFADAMLGHTELALPAAEESLAMASDMGIRLYEDMANFACGMTALAAGDHDAANQLLERYTGDADNSFAVWFAMTAELKLAVGDVAGARARTDEYLQRGANSVFRWQFGSALTTRARIAIVDGEPDRAEEFGHQALTVQLDIGDKIGVADSLELIASVSQGENAARLFGSAAALRRAIGYVRFKTYREWYEAAVAALRGELGNDEFELAWSEGEGLSMHEAVAYAQRGRGERKRHSTGWASLTPAELDIVRLVADGLANKEIAAKLFVSPRTVQAHLTHIYAKLGTSSRVQVAKEAAARA